MVNKPSLLLGCYAACVILFFGITGFQENVSSLVE